MTRSNRLPILIVAAFAIAACGGSDDDTSSPNPATTIATANEQADDATANDESEQEPAANPGSSDLPVPIARFAAHGPQDNAIGTGCAEGIDTRGGDLYRFVPPADYTWKGTGGGTGPDEVTLWSDTDDALLYVTESSNRSETGSLRDWVVVGPTGVDITIDGVAIPIMEVSLEGAPGYAIVDIDYLSPLPGIEAALGTVAVTSDTEGRPTLEEATQLLETVRVERCAVISEAIIWSGFGNARLVPRFEPDPLGKDWPDEAQPAFDPTINLLRALSPAQVAYLMPVGPDIADCAAATAVEQFGDNPIGYLMMLSPTGTNKADLEAIVAAC